jgi:hypothetical protein
MPVRYVTFYSSVADRDHSMRTSSNVLLVCDHYYRIALFMKLLKKLHDLVAGFRIKGPCRLVSEQDRWMIHKSTSDRDTLPLTTREFVWFMGYSIAQLDRGER